MAQLIINNHIIDEPVQNILYQVKKEIRNGKLKDIEVHGSDIKVTCPFHNNGQEKEPDCHIYNSEDGELQYGFFHCFRGDTKVITKEYGAIEMYKIVNINVHILNGNGKWELVTFKNYGKQALMKITLSCNTKEKVIYATPEHEWLLKDKKTKVYTKDLPLGKYLEKCIPNKLVDVKLDPMGIVHGFCYGDGECYFRNEDKKLYYNRCLFYNESDLELKQYFNFNDFYKCIGGNGKEYDAIKFESSIDMKKVPSIDLSNSYLLGFLAGYFTTDGNCHKDKLTIYSHKYDDLYKVQQICTKLGIMSTEIGKSFISKGKRGCVEVKEDTWGYTLRLVRNTIPDNFFITSKGRGSYQKYTSKNRYKIIKVESTNLIEDVYCCQTSTHSFALEHFILTGNCFACDEAGTLPKFIGGCFDEDEYFGKQWLLEHYGSNFVERKINLQPILLGKNNNDKILDESILDTMQEYHPYMLRRKLDLDICKQFKVKYDPKSECLVFPVYDEHNKLRLLTRRSVLNKTFIIDKDTKKPIYLLNEIIKRNLKYCYVCESQINALYLWSLGYPSVAMIGKGSTEQYQILNKCGVRHFILCFDGDEAGDKGRDRFIQNMNPSIMIDVVNVPRGKDMNDLSKEEVDGLLQGFKKV